MFSSVFARRDLLALILAAAAWGVGTVISKRALEEIPPIALLPIQLAASLGILAVLMQRRGIPFRGGATAPLLGRLGLLNPGLAYFLSLLGLGSISASLSVLLWAVEPLLILALAAVFLRERVGPVVVTLSLVAIAGMVLVTYDPATGGQLGGVVLTLAGVACCAIYTVVARHWIGTADSTAQLVFTQQGYALAFAIVALVLGQVLGGGVGLSGVTPTAWLAAIGSGALYYAAAYWFYLTALRGIPASFAAVSFYLIPLFGVGAGYLLLGERLGEWQWVGVVVLLAAVLFVIRAAPIDAASPSPVPAVD
jgi:drug/metabolite transporter (DMT)-like permease